ncbi:MAG: prepilin-type N-terminal cleavage/methylation domain-containing protein [Lysobacterales bacterium]|jgi:prepilin-type N-terminal cleavage/methylation domain-containing protein
MPQHRRNPGQARGFSLLEVLAAIAIFSFGILALAQLQGSLARASGDSAARSVAVNVAEDTIERLRGFSRLSTDPDGIEFAYEDIQPKQFSAVRAGMAYQVGMSVQDYWYDRANEVFTTEEPLVAALSDFKLVTVDVNWGEGPEFRIDDSHTTEGRLGSGGVHLAEVISSVTSAADAKSATGGTGGIYLPSINYSPGSNPEIISISLGQNKFKESTIPLPDVSRQDELAETRFDVVTYSQNDSGATFLRREEFEAVSCECELGTANGETPGGRRPTVWDGNEYTEGEFVDKPFGASTSNVQSRLCDLCCRDHHDGGTGENDQADDPGRAHYDPFRASGDYWDSGALAGDHKHFYRNSDGTLAVAAAAGDPYMESCRMVRRNGFWRVAQDLRQESLNAFPQNYLDNTTEVGEYSDYVTSAMAAYEDAVSGMQGYEQNPPALTAPANMAPPVVFPASTPADPTYLPTPLGIESQQLRSRGIYVDYMSQNLRDVIDCLQEGGTGVDCGAPNVTTDLEIMPFYDVQLTWLSRWTETPVNNPVDITNEAIENDNAHSRGRAQLTAGTGPSTVDVTIHRGNLGLTGTDPIDLNYDADLRAQQLYMSAESDTPPPALNEFLISGLITTGIKGFRASDVEISFSGAECNRTNTGYTCLVETYANNPRLTVTNYYKSNEYRVACSDVLPLQGSEGGANGWTRFNLPHSATTDADIIIQLGSCAVAP